MSAQEAEVLSATAATPKALPPPFIPIPHLPNFRTIGGRPIPDTSLRTRTNFVFRSAAPTGSSPETIKTLEDLNVATFYDVRSAREIERMKDRMPITVFPCSERIFAPVFVDRDGSPYQLSLRLAAYSEVGSAGFVRAYAEILDQGMDSYRKIFTHVRDRPNEPLVVHCTAGKDRTGVVIALMLSFVGLPDEEVAEEYALTELGLKEEIEHWVPHMLQEPAYQGNEEAVRRSLGARKENMLATLTMLKEKWGGAEGYLRRGLGFGEEDVKRIRTNLVESASGTTYSGHG